MSEKLQQQFEKMVRQYADLKAYFAAEGGSADELAVLETVGKDLVGLRQQVGGAGRSAPRDGSQAEASPLGGARVEAGPERKATRPRTETPGYKEASWVRPNASVSTNPVQVGSIFFKTKEAALDGRDEGLLRELAKAYAPYAKRPGATQGLKGSVVGYADPRPSSGPDNPKLSAERAKAVAERLTQLLAAESGLPESSFAIAVTAAGALPAPKIDGPELEANSLATLRRADVFLEGGLLPKPKVVPPPAQTAPDPMILLEVMNLGMHDAFLGEPYRGKQFEKAKPFKDSYDKGWNRGLQARSEKPTSMRGISKEEREEHDRQARRRKLRKQSKEYLETWWSIRIPGD